MTKKDFTKRLLNMGHPVMSECDFGCLSDLVSSTIVVNDKENTREKFEVHTTKLPRSEYLRGEINEFERRARSALIKYERWMHDVCGNYCTSELSIPSKEAPDA